MMTVAVCAARGPTLMGGRYWREEAMMGLLLAMLLARVAGVRSLESDKKGL